MAGNRAASRVHSNPEARRDQLVILGSIVVLAVVAVIVLIGLFLTVYKPPRERILTIGSKQWDASAVERRALYLLQFQQAIAPKSPTEIVSKTLDTLEREEALRQKAKELVPEVTSDDVTKELQGQLAPATPPQPSIQTPDGLNATVTIGTATPVAGASPTATPTVDQAKYTKALQDRLTKSKLTKSELDAVIMAGLYEDRLREKFTNELPKTAAQVNVAVARTSDEALANQIRSIVSRPNVDFSQVASQNSVSATTGGLKTGAPLWVTLDELDGPTRDAVQKLKAGEISPVVKVGDYFEVYKAIEVSADREVTDASKDALTNKKILDWLNKAVADLKPQRTLDKAKEDWITNHAIADFTKAVATPGAK